MEWIILGIILIVFSLLIKNTNKKYTPSINPDKNDESLGSYITISTEEAVLERINEIRNEFNAYDTKIYNALITEYDIKGLYYRPYQVHKRAEMLYIDEELFLEIEVDNPADPYAIKVLTFDGTHIGYIPKYENRDVHSILSKSVYSKCILAHSNKDKDVPFQSLYLFYVIPKTEDELEDIERKKQKNNLNTKIRSNKNQLKKAINEDNTDRIVILSKRVLHYEEELKKLK